MKVRIDSAAIEERTITSRKTGEIFTFRNQEAWVQGELIRFKFQLRLERNQPSYPVGEYEVDLERSLAPGRYGDLEFRVRLQPCKAASVFPKTGTNG